MSDSVFDIEANTAPYINDQLPSIYRDYAGGVASFLQAYYTWLGQPGNVMAQSARFMLDCDVDTTLPEFLIHFEKTYMAGFPYGDLDPSAIVPTIKHIKDVIASKGSVVGLKYMFALVYGVDASIYTPGSDIFKPSDNRWSQKIYIELSYSPLVSQVVGSTITGVTSGATAYVYGFQRQSIEVAGSSNLPPSDSWGQANTTYTQSLTYSGGSRLSYALNIEDVAGQFIVGEAVKFSGIQPTQDNTPIVIGSLGSIDIYQGGIDFAVPDPLAVDIASSDPNIAFGASAVVSNTISRNGVVQFVIANQGQGYVNSTTDPSNFMGQTISLTQANTNPGSGATFDVGTLSNTFILTTSNDFIQPYANTSLSAPSYGMPSFPSANLATTLGTALNFQSIVVGQISTLTHINQGAGYTGEVFVSVVNPVVASLNMDDGSGGVSGNDAAITGDAGRGVGAIQSVVVKQSGVGYVEGQHLGLTSPNDPESSANGIARLSGTGLSIGAWSGTNSFLDNDKKIQDSYYYQSFSYEIDSPLSPESYVDVVKSDWHVAGMQMFGRVVAQVKEPELLEDVVESDSSLPVKVTAYPFAISDGSSNTYTLMYQNRQVFHPTVTAMHQTDWQGRVALSRQPRTNYMLYTANPASGWGIVGGATITTSSAFPGGATVSALATSGIYGLQTPPVTAGQSEMVFASAFVASASSGYAFLQLNYTPNGMGTAGNYVALSLATGTVTKFGALALNNLTASRVPGGWRVSFNFSLNAGDTVYAYIGPAGSGDVADGAFRNVASANVTFGGVSFASIDGPFVPTTSTPVTLTDYAVDASGDVSLGQTPAKNALLDWDGAGYTRQSGTFAQVPVSVANAQFMIGDGVSNAANLLDGSGNIVVDPTVTAVRQTDWQGTVILSSQPRTNIVYASNMFNTWNSNQITKTDGFLAPDGTLGAVQIMEANVTGQHYLNTGLSAAPNTNSTYTLSVFASPINNRYLVTQHTDGGSMPVAECTFDLVAGTVVRAINGASASIVPAGHGYWRCFTTFTTSSTATRITPRWGTSSANTWATSGYVGVPTNGALLAYCLCEQTSLQTSYIPTLSSAATVTDYAPNPSFKNQLLLGQTPAANATLNWDGSGYTTQPG
jgi:hypothetical protein